MFIYCYFRAIADIPPELLVCPTAVSDTTDSDTAPAFGFLAGKEVKAAGVGNLGLQDRQYCLGRGFVLRKDADMPSCRTSCIEMDTKVYLSVRRGSCEGDHVRIFPASRILNG